MSDSNFKWKTDEEWEEPHTIEAIHQPAQPRRWGRWLAITAVILLLAGGVGWTIYNRIQQQIATAETRVQQEALSTQDLLLQASNEQDPELFISLLSGRDPQWVEFTAQLAEEGHLFDRPAIGLQRIGEPQLIDTAVDPEYKEAILTLHQKYQTTTGDIITLQQTAIYRQGQERWLYAPPTGNFWKGFGEMEPSPKVFNAQYPIRDRDLVEQITQELEQTLTFFCKFESDLTCPDEDWDKIGRAHV